MGDKHNSDLRSTESKTWLTYAQNGWHPFIFWQVIGLGFFVFFIYYQIYGVPERAGVGMTMHLFHNVEGQLHDFYHKHGSFPPLIQESSYYGPLDDSLTTPVPIVDDVPTTPGLRRIYAGPAVDPFRRTALFDNDVMKKAWYRDGRNSEGLNSWFRGHAPRYYRSADGRYASFLATDPIRT